MSLFLILPSRLSERFLGCNWREEWVVLHEDSALEWYKGHDEEDLLGAIMLKVRKEKEGRGVRRWKKGRGKGRKEV